jgi:hypothetical protein
MQVLLAVSALRAGKAPRIANLAQPAHTGLRYALETTVLAAGPALITAASPSGACAALVLAS